MFEKYLTPTGKLSCKQPQEVKDLWYTKKFQEVHGDKYDYSEVGYINNRTNITIICKDHGCFAQKPNDHYKGQGCPKCGGKQKKNTQQCVEDFRKVHKDLYDYSKVKYYTCYNKVEIICEEHGSFLQTPSNHLSGNGCPKCKGKNQHILYILKCVATGLIKIGITNNLKVRINSIGGKIECLHQVEMPNPRVVEQELHAKYRQFNVYNNTVRTGNTEFFNLTPQQVSEIFEYAAARSNQ